MFRCGGSKPPPYGVTPNDSARTGITCPPELSCGGSKKAPYGVTPNCPARAGSVLPEMMPDPLRAKGNNVMLRQRKLHRQAVAGDGYTFHAG